MICSLLRDSRRQAVAPTQAIKAVSVKEPDSLLPVEPSIQHPTPHPAPRCLCTTWNAVPNRSCSLTSLPTANIHSG